MKRKILALITALCIALCFSSCGVQNESSQTTTETVSDGAITVSVRETVKESSKSETQTKGTTKKENTEKSKEKSTSSKKVSTKKITSTKNKQASTSEETQVQSEQSSKTDVPTQQTTQSDNNQYCYLTVECKSILKNMDKLAPGHEGFVPSSGMIIERKKYEIKANETAFDVLKSVCSEENVALEYTYTPMYKSYYVEGINQLHEFDCGKESGWVYTVNSSFMSVASSSYYVKSNDEIVFSYTCKNEMK